MLHNFDEPSIKHISLDEISLNKIIEKQIYPTPDPSFQKEKERKNESFGTEGNTRQNPTPDPSFQKERKKRKENESFEIRDKILDNQSPPYTNAN